MHWLMGIGRANLHEQTDRQAELRIQVAIVGARSAEQSTFIYDDVCVSGHVRFRLTMYFTQDGRSIFRDY